jgi:hypothetical protein
LSGAYLVEINATVDVLDTTISQSRRRWGPVRRVRGLFTGHEPCIPTLWVNGLILFDTSNSYYPDALGQRHGYYAAITAIKIAPGPARRP